MKTIVLSLLFVIPLKLWSQQPGQPPVHIVEEEVEIIEPRPDPQRDSNFVYSYVEESPEFPGGMTTCYHPARRSGLPGFNKEAIRLVKAMPAWKPGRSNGKGVKCYYHLPIIFRLG